MSRRAESSQMFFMERGAMTRPCSRLCRCVSISCCTNNSTVILSRRQLERVRKIHTHNNNTANNKHWTAREGWLSHSAIVAMNIESGLVDMSLSSQAVRAVLGRAHVCDSPFSSHWPLCRGAVQPCHRGFHIESGLVDGIAI